MKIDTVFGKYLALSMLIFGGPSAWASPSAWSSCFAVQPSQKTELSEARIDRFCYTFSGLTPEETVYRFYLYKGETLIHSLNSSHVVSTPLRTICTGKEHDCHEIGGSTSAFGQDSSASIGLSMNWFKRRIFAEIEYLGEQYTVRL